MKASKLFLSLAVALGLSLSANVGAQELDQLPNYVPVLPQIKAKALAVDTSKGYLVQQVKPGGWIDKLAAVGVYGASHCRAALIYVRWDD